MTEPNESAAKNPENRPSADAEKPAAGTDQTAEPNPESAPNSVSESTVLAGEMTDAERAEAREYGRKCLACSLLDRAIDLGYLAVAAFLLAIPLDNWFLGCPFLSQHDTLRLVVLFTAIFGLHVAVSFPLSVYSGYSLEHRFSLSTQSLWAWAWSYTKRIVLGWAFSAALFAGLFWLIWLTGGHWWWIAAGAFFVIGVLISQLAPVLILPLFYKVEKLDTPDLTARFDHLVEGTDLSIEGVYELHLSQETVKANAMLAGMGRTRRVLLGDTLLKNLSHEETEVVFAHEVGHHVFRHIRKLILFGLVASLFGFWICNQVLVHWVGTDGPTFNYAQLPVYTLPMIMFVLSVFTQLLEPMQNTLARRFERQCDRYALRRTKNPAAYRRAFEKLARLNKDNPDPHPLEVFLFDNHPPIAERLAMADEVPSSK